MRNKIVKVNFQCEGAKFENYNKEVVNMESTSNKEDNSFAYGQMTFLSTRENSHKLLFTEELLRQEAKTFLNKPLVAEFSKEDGDVTTHTNNQTIVGWIPSEQELQFTQGIDGFLEVKADILISKIYASDVYELFTSNNYRNVSIEANMNLSWESDSEEPPYGEEDISVNAIEGFGVTILGMKYNPSVPMANVQITQMGAESAYREITMSKVLSKLNDIEAKIEGEVKMSIVKLAVEIGDGLWNKVYDYLYENYPQEDGWGSIYRIDGIYETEDGDKYVILTSREDSKMYKVELKYSKDEFELKMDDMKEVTVKYVEAQKLEKIELSKIMEYENSRLKGILMEQKEKLESQEANLEETKEETEMAKTEEGSETEMAKEVEKETDMSAKLEAIMTEMTKMKTALEQKDKEIAELQEIKLEKMESDKEKVVNSVLTKLETFHAKDTEEYKKVELEAKECKFEDVESWKMTTMSMIADLALEAIKIKSVSVDNVDGIVQMGMPKADESKTSTDIFHD